MTDDTKKNSHDLPEIGPIDESDPLSVTGELISRALNALGYSGHYVLIFEAKDGATGSMASMPAPLARRIVCVLAEEFLKEGGVEFAKFVSSAKEKIQ